MKGKLLLLLIVTMICINNKAKAQVNVNDSLTLVEMYNTMNGPNWYIKDNWLQGPVSAWFGVYVENNRVVQLYFNFDNNLSGNFPASLSSLTELRTFIFQGNKIAGAIPSSFSRLTKMTEFILTYSQISGNIPSFFGNWQSLIGIDLRHNQLTGSIPGSLGKIANITYIQVDDNQLTGKIPASIGNLTKLQILSAANNELTGTVPTFKSAVMSNLWLDHNLLSGPLPDFHLSIHMDELSLDHNQFSGSIPDWMGLLNNSSHIDLENNQLTGSIPASFGNLLAWSINVSNNNLSGTVPTTFRNRSIYSVQYIENNHFTFDGLDSILLNKPTYYFSYSPQLSIPVHLSNQGNYGKLSVYAGGTLSDNTYSWYRNNLLYKSVVGDSTFTPDSAGNYFVKVSNSIVTNLTLSSDTIIVAEPCAAAPTNTASEDVQATSALLSWSQANGASQYQVKYKPTGGAFTTINSATNSLNLTGLLPNTKYTWKVRSRCSQGFSPFTSNNTFRTPAAFSPRYSADYLVAKSNFSVTPNPAGNFIDIFFSSGKQCAYAINIYDLQGKLMTARAGITANGENKVSFHIENLTKGLYIVKLIHDEQTRVCKFVKL